MYCPARDHVPDFLLPNNTRLNFISVVIISISFLFLSPGLPATPHSSTDVTCHSLPHMVESAFDNLELVPSLLAVFVCACKAVTPTDKRIPERISNFFMLFFC